MDTNNNRIRKVLTNGTIITIAGDGTSGFTGDGGLSSAARVYRPSHGIFNAYGDLIFTDEYNHRIRIIHNNGTIATIAGLGSSGFAGDGGNALLAKFSYPKYVTLFNDEIYIIDSNNKRIRKVDTNGNISTVIGSSASSYSGDGYDSTLANVVNLNSFSVRNKTILLSDNFSLRYVNTTGKISTIAGLSSSGYSPDGSLANISKISPTCVYNGGEELFFCDGSTFLRKIKDNVLYTLAGTNDIFAGNNYLANVSLLTTAYGVTVKQSTGEIYLAQAFSASSIRRVDSRGIISVYAGILNTRAVSEDGYNRLNTSFVDPTKVAFGPNGDVYVSEYGTNKIRKISASTGLFSLFAGKNGGSSNNGILATTASLITPIYITVGANGDVYITESSLIRKIVASSGYIYNYAGQGSYSAGYAGDGGQAVNAKLNGPVGIKITSSGILYIADTWNDRIRMVAANGIISTVAGNGTAGFFGKFQLFNYYYLN